QEQRTARGDELLTVAIEDIGLAGYYSDVRIIDLAGLADPEWARPNYASGQTIDYPAEALIHDKRPEVVVIVSASGRRANPLVVEWRTNRDIYRHPDFLRLYREKAMLTHKDFPGDGYFLHVFLRNDLHGEAPDLIPPKPRA